MSYSVKDFTSNQEVRWCPGCGDYAILKALRLALVAIGTPPEQVVCVSGIGCAGRLPYYMATFGLHTIHGRAPAVATGLAMTRPDLDIWIITGDGDGLSIGSGHLLHCLRRSLPLRIILFNNATYGLTKGQLSPTAAMGAITATSLGGTRARPVNPCLFALTAGAGFVARTGDILQAQLLQVFQSCHATSAANQRPAFVEVLQNCPVYNDQVFAKALDRNQARRNTITLSAGDLMLFGENAEFGLAIDHENHGLITVAADAQAKKDRILRHDPGNFQLAMLLANLHSPVPMGIIYQAAAQPAAPIQNIVGNSAGKVGTSEKPGNRQEIIAELQQVFMSN